VKGREGHYCMIAMLKRLRFDRLPFVCLTGIICLTGPGWSAAGQDETGDWVKTLMGGPGGEGFQREFPVEWDWLHQDFGREEADRIVAGKRKNIGADALAKVLTECGESGKSLQAAAKKLQLEKVPAGAPQWLALYAEACEIRRALRLKTVTEKAAEIVFVKRHTIKPSFFAYTEGQSDAQAERHFPADSALCMMTLDGTRARVTPLLEDKGGAFRDPAISWDGKRLAFAWKKSLNDDDYHLYEMDLASRKLRQVTNETGVADYEPAYLPNGDFVFSSSRCVQTIDCWWTEGSNLYTCDPKGRNIRRLGFDQVHTVYPQVLDDGRVVYTRWDYNDRGQVFPQPLFQMNPDGTNQTEYYGNNSWFPTTIAHARGIPGTSKVLAVLCGHHTAQAGKLAVIDPALGRQENEGVQLVSPKRETRAVKVDTYGQKGELFRYPFPLGEREWLVSYAPNGWKGGGRRGGDADFGIYWMDIDGRRELLTTDAEFPCQQPVPVMARSRPVQRPSSVDFAKESGSYYVQDIYQGPGLKDIERGTIKKLRVVALEFRPAGVRSNGSGGPAGGALVSTPISIGNGAWDVKRVLGETPVHEDGSASFVVPARTPVYFQALDERGRTLQTMRSWSTLQPGENASCVGCHENKNSAPPGDGYGATLAMKRPPLKLEPFHGPVRGFSFTREIQPILDRHCVRCHNDRDAVAAMIEGKGPPPFELPAEQRSHGEKRAFSLLGEKVPDTRAGREWTDSYLVLTQSKRDGKGKAGAFRGKPDGKILKWISSQSVPTALPPEYSGSTKSPLLDLLDDGHFGVKLPRADYEKIACWIDLLVPFCGDYTEANIWTEKEMKKYRRYENKRKRMDEIDRETVNRLAGEH